MPQKAHFAPDRLWVLSTSAKESGSGPSWVSPLIQVVSDRGRRRCSAIFEHAGGLPALDRLLNAP